MLILPLPVNALKYFSVSSFPAVALVLSNLSLPLLPFQQTYLLEVYRKDFEHQPFYIHLAHLEQVLRMDYHRYWLALHIYYY